MPRGFLTFGDIEGKLDVLRVECTRCDRKGLYLVRKLIEMYGRKGNMMKWREMLNADCPKRLPGFITAAIKRKSPAYRPTRALGNPICLS